MKAIFRDIGNRGGKRAGLVLLPMVRDGAEPVIGPRFARSRLLSMRPHPEERALTRVSKDAPHAHLRDLATRFCASFAKSFAPSSNRGRREDRVRAAPAVSCAMCIKTKRT